MMYSPKGMTFLLLVLSVFSRFGSRVKNILYDRSVLSPKIAPLPVISVGNIALGGTEKTPLALDILAWLLDKGFRPALVSRGYKGRWERNGGVLSDGREILGTWEEGGDEPFMVARNLPQAGVFVGKNRFSSCVRARQSGFNVVVLDDGFQHRRLARDLDIVLYSPEEKITLREPRSSLKRADVCLVKNKDYSVVSRGFFSPWNQEKISAEALAKKKVLAFCGIARPQRFFGLVREEGLEVVSAMSFPDHHAYPPSSLRKIVRAYRETSAEAVLTTEKDSVKIEAQRSSFGNIPVFYLKIGLRVEPELDEKMRRLLEKTARS